MANYKIIMDEDAAVYAISSLPNLKDHERYMMCLFSRKKYANDPTACPSESLLKRVVCKQEYMLTELLKMQVEKGLYRTKDGRPVPEESLCVYLNPNPRSLEKAKYKTIRALLKSIEDNQDFINPRSVAMTSIHQSKSYSAFVDFDIDDKTIDLSELNVIFPDNEDWHFFSVLETRGGYHIIVNMDSINKAPKELFPQDWYRVIKKTFPVDQAGDELLPIPGCIQGGFVPRWKSV